MTCVEYSVGSVRVKLTANQIVWHYDEHEVHAANPVCLLNLLNFIKGLSTKVKLDTATAILACMNLEKLHWKRGYSLRLRGGRFHIDR